MAMPGMFKYLLVSALFVELAAAATYIVGGPNGGWDMATNQQTWASSQSFRVGDNLVFQYSPSDDVAEVSIGEYDSCQASNPMQAYGGGLSLISLTSPGKRYFISSIPSHCSAGMKLAVDTLAGSSAAPAESPAVSAPITSLPLGFGFSPVPSVAPEISMSSPSEPPVPKPSPSRSESPVPGTSGLAAGVQGSEDSANSTPLSRSTTTLDSPDSSASRSWFPSGFGKSLSFVVMMFMAL
ncbi:hypothetical protein SAY87_001409 [Trapa incisa]|uniref:Phytocyanin domain-containing protein n=1 Tax=Trapa incisa TaxID=236973 RepID=A0AAN7JHU5_9MYRT|nr:hypothetical protein SAY87_001409 [Trapa incisa]